MATILSSLMNSVRKGELQQVTELIDSYGVSHSRNWSEGYVLLRTAIEYNRKDIAKLLLTKGARVNTKNTKPCDTPLYFAVRNRDLEIVKMLLTSSANVNAKSREGITPLLISVKYRNIEITRLLLDHGADINVRDHRGLLPLHIAVERGNVQIAEDLLNQGASINSQCTFGWRDGYTPLHLACGSQKYASGSKEEIVTFLLSKNANINSVAKDNLMPLYIATKNGHNTIVKLFLEHGANVGAEDKNGKKVLYLAVEKGHETIVKLLLEHGANVDTQDKDGKTILHLSTEKNGYSTIIEHILKYSPDVNNKSNRTSLHIPTQDSGRKYIEIIENLLKSGYAIDYVVINNCKMTTVEALLKYGANLMSLKYIKTTLLHSATENNHVEIAKLLIKFGADVNARDEVGKTPIYYATENKNLKIAELLLNNGANIKDSPEVLHEAVRKGCRELVEMFIQHGTDINGSDKLGRTALYFTTSTINIVGIDCDITVRGEIVKLLLNEGANINAQTENGITTLHAAIEFGYVRIVEILLNNGADINSQEENGLTPLHIATQLGNKTVVKLLLERGAKIVSEIGTRLTPLHIAAQKGYVKIIKILLEFGADIDSRDEEGRTALHIACYFGCEEVVIALLEYGSNINNINIDSALYGISECGEFQYDSDYYYFDKYNIHRHYSDYSDYKFSYVNDYDHPSVIAYYENVFEILHKHIIQMRTVNFYVSEENLGFLRYCEFMDNFVSECQQEIERMEVEKIGNSNVSFSDFLTEDIHKLAIYVRNENVEQVLKSDDYKTKFPLYASMINKCFKKGVERKKLLEQCITFFHSLFNSLPYNCTEKIVCYLSNTDLGIVIDTCNSSNTDTSN